MGKGNKDRGREKKKPKQAKKPATTTAVAPRGFNPSQPAPTATPIAMPQKPQTPQAPRSAPVATPFK
jgi:hypothetical protein